MLHCAVVRRDRRERFVIAGKSASARPLDEVGHQAVNDRRRRGPLTRQFTEFDLFGLRHGDRMERPEQSAPHDSQ